MVTPVAFVYSGADRDNLLVLRRPRLLTRVRIFERAPCVACDLLERIESFMQNCCLQCVTSTSSDCVLVSQTRSVASVLTIS